MMRQTACLILSFLAALPALSSGAAAQQVQPVISEYVRTADGFFQVKNEGTTPQIVTLEPKSFSLNEDGTGVLRPLDASIHLELSATSLRLEPQGTARIFYKVKADALPAWLCIYSSFSPAKESKGVNLRIMLPHTVYLYSKDEVQKADIVVTDVRYDETGHHVLATLENHGHAAGRVAELEVDAGRTSQMGGGFPMLPGGRRQVQVDWTAEKRPEDLHVRFAKFALKLPIPASAQE